MADIHFDGSLALAALEAGKDVALANKETLVMAGELMLARARETGARLLPIDSEHCALHECLDGRRPEHVRRLILTASGGPFRNRSRESFESITREEALEWAERHLDPEDYEEYFSDLIEEA